MRARDAWLNAVEAAYVVHGDDRAWLDGIRVALESAKIGPWIGYTVDGKRIESFVGDFPTDPQAILDATRRLPEAMLRQGHAPAPPVELAVPKWTRVTKAFGWTMEQFNEVCGYPPPSLCALLGTDARGTGPFFAVPAARALPVRTRRKLTEVAAHIAAAYRLRMRLRGEHEPDAVCKADGRMLDGTRTAVANRASIALAVKRVDRARGKMRRLDPDEAVTAWRAMVDGTWSLVDHVEQDGKRCVLVHKNPPRATLTALRPMEARVATFAALGHSNKYIAYELGLASSTVASHLGAVLQKLKLRHRSELVAMYGPLARVRGSRRG